MEKTHHFEGERNQETPTAEWLAAEELPSVTKLSLEDKPFPLLVGQSSSRGGCTTLRAHIAHP
jgi:hypothetical protein